MPKKKKEESTRERIKKQLELVKKLKEKKQEERESFELRVKGKSVKGKISSHGEKHEKFTPGHHGNR